MNRDAIECLKRTAECARLAEAEKDPNMRLFLKNLTLSWMQEANKSVNGHWSTPNHLCVPKT
jgi:hypothetical protein